jgi:L,D-transpeptidase YbiS
MLTLRVIISEQQMYVLDKEHIIQSYAVSTAKKGVGEVYGSEQTPRGWHVIRAKIGTSAPINTVFIKRRPTGEIFKPELRQQFPQRDWILTRIMWLSGLEKGKNRLGNVDTMRRFVYIHGTPDDVDMRIPGSHGCIRMRNSDIIALYNLVPVGTKILIQE